MAKLTEKQQRFCDLYIKYGDATRAAIDAGYSKKTAKNIGCENLTKPYLRAYIDERLEKMEKERIMDATEVMQLLTSAARGEILEEVVVTEGEGDGVSRTRIVKKQISAKDRLKAAELVGKRYMMFTEKTRLEGAIPVIISGEDDLED